MDHTAKGQGELVHPGYCPGTDDCEHPSGDIVHTHVPNEVFIPDNDEGAAVAFALVRNDDFGADGEQRIAPQDVAMDFGGRRVTFSLETFRGLVDDATATVMRGHLEQRSQPPTASLLRLPAPIPRRKPRHRR